MYLKPFSTNGIINKGGISKTNKSGVHNVVIDLRHNGGGDLRLASEMFYLLGVDTIAKLGSLKVKVSDYFAQQLKRDFVEKDKVYRKIYGKPLPIDGSLVHFDSLEDAYYADFFHVVKAASKPLCYINPTTPRFKGHVYYLTGSGTFSAANITAAMIKDNHLGTIVGSKTGNRPTVSTGGLGFKLPHSKIPVHMSYMFATRPDPTQKDEDGLTPNVEQWQSFDDFKNGIDTPLEWIIKDIERKKGVAMGVKR